ncbi:mitogen-activated protein kinase kinase kinase 2-like [Camellia sinensis]|uniref:mitogen-activated protein kinase kinase kinase 2-like n=1 Tax=Camellia sinensis TaxID=4442 RepID=UPI001036CDE2|nr:mitogen-activated protein kinase kinase kinase 2-like [Camellia sinensis]
MTRKELVKAAKAAQNLVEEKAKLAEDEAEVARVDLAAAKAKATDLEAKLQEALDSKEAEVKAADEKAFKEGQAADSGDEPDEDDTEDGEVDEVEEEAAIDAKSSTLNEQVDLTQDEEDDLNIIIVLIITGTGTEYVAKIGDFGLAKRAKQMRMMVTMSKSCKLRGSLGYSSPETVVYKGLQQESPSDVWALGMIVFEMLAGKSVWDGKQDSEVEDILSEIGKGHGLLKLPNQSEVSEEAMDFLKGCFAGKAMDRLTTQMLLNHPFAFGLGEDSEDDEEELSVEDSEENDCSPSSSLSLSDYESDDWNLRVKKPKVDEEAISVCSLLSYEYNAVDDDEHGSSCVSYDWSNMPLETEELQEVDRPLSLSVCY